MRQQEEEDYLNPEVQWRESMRRLLRVTVVVLRSTRPSVDRWKHVGWLMRGGCGLLRRWQPDARVYMVCTARPLAARVQQGDGASRSCAPGGSALCYGTSNCSAGGRRASRTGLDAAGVYAPTEISAKGDDGKAPKRLRDAFEDMAPW